MIHAEILLLILLNAFIVYLLLKKRDSIAPIDFKNEVKVFKKAFGTNVKRKPLVNDDHNVWLKENTK